MVYFDNSSTTRQYDEVSLKMLEVMKEDYGNPSSLHRMGIKTEKLVSEARREIAKSLHVDEDTIFFTSGGTESDNTAIICAAQANKRRGKRIITSKVEHPAILEPCKYLESQGFEVIYLDVTKEGFVQVDELKAALTKDTILVSIMAVNNESGAIMPIQNIAREIKEYNKKNGCSILFHSDLVQGYGKLDIDAGILDIASISGHKIHGPKGIGAIYVKKGIKIDSFILGGGQEKHFRSGTENVPAIVGFGVAAKIARENLSENTRKMEKIKTMLLTRISEEIKDVKVNTPLDNSVASVLNVSFLNTRGEVILHSLEQKNIYVSTGSACASNHKNKGGSHVLRAMGLKDKEIEGAIRFSFGALNTENEVDIALHEIKLAIESFRRLGSFR